MPRLTRPFPKSLFLLVYCHKPSGLAQVSRQAGVGPKLKIFKLSHYSHSSSRFLHSKGPFQSDFDCLYLCVAGLANQRAIFIRVTNERAGAVKMVTDHGVIISYQFTLALGPTHSSPAHQPGWPPMAPPYIGLKTWPEIFSGPGHSPDLVTNNDPGAVNLLISPR